MPLVKDLVAICTYRLVMISNDLFETTQKKRTGNPRQGPRQIQSKAKSETIFFF